MEPIKTPAKIYTPPAGTVTYEVNLYLGDAGMPPVINLMQYDDTIPIVAAKIFYNGMPYKIPDGAAVNIREEKPDGKHVYNPALGVSSDRSTAYIAITHQMTAADGQANACVEVYKGGILGTSLMTLNVQKNPVPENAIASTDEYKTMQELHSEVVQSAESVKTDAGKAETAATKAEAAANRAERAECRIDDSTTSTQTTWSSAKNSLDFAGAFKNQVSSEIVVVDDVSPVEHEVGCRVESKNIIKAPYFDTGKTVNGVEYTILDDGLTISCTGRSTGYSILNITAKEPLGDLKGKTAILSGVLGVPKNMIYNLSIYGKSDNYLGEFKTASADPIVCDLSKYPNGEYYYLEVKPYIRDGTPSADTDFKIKPQLEIGDKATPYTPPIPDLSKVKVSRSGKNLLNINGRKQYDIPFSKPDVPRRFDYDGYYVGLSRNNAGNLNAVLSYSLGSGTVSLTTRLTFYGIGFPVNLLHNTKYRFSCTIDNQNNGRVSVMYYDNTGKFIDYIDIVTSRNKIQGEFVVPLECKTVVINIATVNTEPITFSDIMLSTEENTEYLPYNGYDVYEPLPSGEVQGMTSLSPNMSILSDTPGVIINAEYNQDGKKYVDKKIEELKNAVLSLGGNI